VGIELEVNQRFVFESGPQWSLLRDDITQALKTVMALPKQ
jgi:hypothetical protein